MKTPKKKFKAIEKDAEIKSKKVGDIEWEGEEVQAESKTKIQEDTGEGIPIVLRFFDFGVNPETFKIQKPTAQELFNQHIRGMESLIWRDGLKPYNVIEPRFMFSKDKSHYRFVLACIPSGTFINQDTQTLSQILK